MSRDLATLGGIRDLTARIAAVEARVRRLGHRRFSHALEELVVESARGRSEAHADALVAAVLWLVHASADDVAALRTHAETLDVLPLLLTAGAPAHKRLARGGRLPDVGLLGTARVKRHLTLAPPAPSEGDSPWDDDAYAPAPGDELRPGPFVFRDQHPFVRRQVARLAMHPDPVAIDRLLHDRATRVADVVRIAARRPTTDAIVHAITSHHGWMGHPAVRYALAANPFTPTRVALLLVPTCRPRLRSLARANVDPRVRALAARLA